MTTRYYIRKRHGMWWVYVLMRGGLRPHATQRPHYVIARLEWALNWVRDHA
jgi:hypothetical protein